jgi:CUE domain.
MEKKSQKIADLAGMFDDIDIEVIEGVLEMCEGHVNQAANVLIKMQEDSSAKPSPIQEKKK